MNSTPNDDTGNSVVIMGHFPYFEHTPLVCDHQKRLCDSSVPPAISYLSSTWCEFDPNTAYVVCISICPYFLIWYPYAPTSLFGNTAHCSGCGVAMGCYRLCIVPRTAIVTSQWYDRYCFTEYARTWARHPTTPWQREYTAITDCQSIDSL